MEYRVDADVVGEDADEGRLEHTSRGGGAHRLHRVPAVVRQERHRHPRLVGLRQSGDPEGHRTSPQIQGLLGRIIAGK